MNNLNKNTKNNLVAKALRSLVGACPFAGQLLCEIIDEIIPNQKIDRLIKFVEILDQKLSKLSEKEFVQKEIKKEECTDFFEEGLRQASRALSSERREYIANIIANRLSSDDITYNESKHLLQILGELNDIEIIWLRYYFFPQTRGADKEFCEKHKDIFKIIYPIARGPQEHLDKVALQGSYKEHLARLGLLEHEYAQDIQTGMPEFDQFKGGLKSRGYGITLLGKLLSRKIGLVGNKES